MFSREVGRMQEIPYPVAVSVEMPASSSRLLALLGLLFWLKSLLILPSFIVVMVLSMAATVVAWVGYAVVLFTGRMPRGIEQFLTGTLRWSTRVTAWLWGLTDRYPPFRLRP
jgi:hypothetical protein